MEVETIEGSRVRAIVANSIMVALVDVKPGDILHIAGNEGDPIIQEVLFDDDLAKLVYVPREGNDGTGRPWIKESQWMMNEGGNIFIHDLRNERGPYLEAQ